MPSSLNCPRSSVPTSPLARHDPTCSTKDAAEDHSAAFFCFKFTNNGAQRRAFDEDLARSNLKAIQDELVQLEAQHRKLQLGMAERALDAARPEKEDAADKAALLKIERQRTFLYTERDKHLSVLERRAKQIDIQWLQEEMEEERAVAKRVQSQRQLLLLDIQAGNGVELFQKAEPTK